jgi:hypothetical protein
MTKKKRLLPIGEQSFLTIRLEDFIYVDKTRHIYDIISTGRYYFFSRPRRFGKSLLISTLAEIFKGNKELFKGLEIYSSSYDWQPYQVIVLNLSLMNTSSVEAFKKDMSWKLDDMGRQQGIDLTEAPSISMKLQFLIQELGKKSKVVVLVDEYDFPLLGNIEDYEKAESFRKAIRELFIVLKDNTITDLLRFVFITGITKFSKTSIFSGLNNLQDITLDLQAAQLLGYTTAEIKKFFAEYLEERAHAEKTSVDEILHNMKYWYDGYQFVDPAKSSERLYNPFSVMLYLKTGDLQNFWFQSGTPTFLIKLMKQQNFPVQAIEKSQLNLNETELYDIGSINLVNVLWQSGYLTIESYNKRSQNFTLNFPNQEVKASLYQFILEELTSKKISSLANTVDQLTTALAREDLESFFGSLKTFFAQIPYTIQLPLEKYYQSLFYVLLKLVGADITSEDVTNNGRIDAVIETPQCVYIFEFKLDKGAQEALAQILEKKYFEKFTGKGTAIYLVGVDFDTEKRTLGEWVSKKLG